MDSVPAECMNLFMKKSGTAEKLIFRLLEKSIEMRDFFILKWREKK